MKAIFFLSATMLILGSACNSNNAKNEHDGHNMDTVNNEEVSENEAIKTATVQIQAKSGSRVNGDVTFIESNGVVTMTVNLKNIAPGKHAIHIHEIGDCSSEDGKSAGGHWNPTNVAHGKWDSGSFHLGDIGNIVAGKDSTATFTRETNLWNIDGSDKSRNIIGKAIIVHEGEDDFTTQPSGKAGARIACGEIVRTQ